MTSGDRAGLSADGALLALQHAEHGDVLHPSLRIIDPRTGGTVGERGDGSSSVLATAWSPVEGDLRLATVHDEEDRERAAICGTSRPMHGRTSTCRFPAMWPPWTGGRTGRRCCSATRTTAVTSSSATTSLRRRTCRIDTPPGSIADARVRPDGSVWYRHTDGVHRARMLDDHGDEPIAVLGEAAPPGRPFLDWRYENDHGQQVHGWVVEPEGEGPHPVMVFVHGGPHWLYEDAYMPEVQAYVDAGFLVAMPNYRGSSGYGRAWSDALTGDVGFTDVDDVTAGLRDVLRRPDVDPSRTVVAGWSWGGYITLMELGRYPGLWSAGMAGVPVGDYVRAYDEEAPSLQALDRALMGGTPETEPDALPAFEPAHLCRSGRRARPAGDRRERLPMPGRSGARVRASAEGPREAARGLPLHHGARGPGHG